MTRDGEGRGGGVVVVAGLSVPFTSFTGLSSAVWAVVFLCVVHCEDVGVAVHYNG